MKQTNQIKRLDGAPWSILIIFLMHQFCLKVLHIKYFILNNSSFGIWEGWKLCKPHPRQIHSHSNHSRRACLLYNIHKRVHVCSHSTPCLCKYRVFHLQQQPHHHLLLHPHTGGQKRRGPRNSGKYPRECWRAERWSSPTTLVTLSCFEGFQLQVVDWQVQVPNASSECVV